jgi:hypothetical protein
MVFVYLEGYAAGAPSYTTCPDANALPERKLGPSGRLARQASASDRCEWRNAGRDRDSHLKRCGRDRPRLRGSDELDLLDCWSRFALATNCGPRWKPPTSAVIGPERA